MTRHRSVLACVAIAAAIGVGLPGLAAATADGGTEPPPTNAPIDTVPDDTDPGTTTTPVTSVVAADPPTTEAPTTTIATTTTVPAAPPSTTEAPTTTIATTTTVPAAPPSTAAAPTTTQAAVPVTPTAVAPARTSTSTPTSTIVTAVPRAKPSAPRTAVATATGASGEIRLSWYAPLTNGGSAITDYVIQRSANGVSNWASIADGVNTATTYTVKGLANGTRSYFRVYARNAVGSSPASNVTNAVPVNALTAPRSLVAAPTNVTRQVRLTWTAPLSNGGRAITDYVIQRSPNGSTGWTTIADGTRVTTAYTVTGLNDGTRYFFRVSARTSRATGPSSAVVAAVPRTKPTAPRSTTAAPTNLSGQVRLTWVAPSSNGGAPITDYVIQRSSNGTTWTTIADGVGTATRYTVTGLANGSRSYFRVLAKNGAGIGATSATVNAVPRTVPTAPTRLWGRSDPDGYSLDWDVPASNGGSAITGYILDSSRRPGAWVRIGDGFPNETWDYVGGRVGCVQFRVAATNAAGVGPFSTIRVC